MPPGRHARSRSRAPVALGTAAVVVAAAGTAVAASRSTDGAAAPSAVTTSSGAVLFDESFAGPDGLVTNEYAAENPGRGVSSPTWLVTSGSLFRRGGMAWSGAPDTLAPGPTSLTNTNSDVFRMVTRRDDFRDVQVSVQFQVVRFDDRSKDAFDGMHVFVRYRSPESLLVVSVCRRDNVVTVKKKVAGGDTNGGTYYTLASVGATCATGRWHTAVVDVRDEGTGVRIDLSLDGRHVLTGRDEGVGGPPMQGAGRVGIRADYVEFLLRRFTVRQAAP